MTTDEILKGLLRLALITVALVAVALIASAVYLSFGSHGRAALAAGTGTIGILLVLSGVAAFAKASPVRHARATPEWAEIRTEERRETEHLALGLFAYGIAFSVIALAVG